MREIERKFALKVDTWKKLSKTVYRQFIKQGYLITIPDFHCRVRINTYDNVTESTFCTKLGSGISREEFESKIDHDHAQALMLQCHSVLGKIRVTIKHEGLMWDLDYFPKFELAVAEVEIPTEDHKIILPKWVGREVTGQSKYSNVLLARKSMED